MNDDIINKDIVKAIDILIKGVDNQKKPKQRFIDCSDNLYKKAKGEGLLPNVISFNEYAKKYKGE